MRFQLMVLALLFDGCALARGEPVQCGSFGEAVDFDMVERPGGTCSGVAGSFVAFSPYSLAACHEDTGWSLDAGVCARSRKCSYTFTDGSTQDSVDTVRIDDAGAVLDVVAQFSGGASCDSTYDIQQR